MNKRNIRVYVVDDSLVARLALEELLVADGMEVVGTATNGTKALRDVPQLRPDVVLMDIMMPQMNGLECTRALMSSCATPILIVSDLVGARANLNFEALEAGALDVCRKPTRAQLGDATARAQFCRQVRLAAEIPVVTRRTIPVIRSVAAACPPVATRSETCPDPPSAVFIGASTGGPLALRDVLADLHGRGPGGPPIVIAQHMTRGFLAGLATWLSIAMKGEVELAQHGMRLHPGRVILAPDDRSVELDGDRLLLVDAPARGSRPSVDVLFQSAAHRVDADRVCAILLSGMGRDGARGLAALRRQGAWTIAQDEATSVIWGMPKVAIDLGAAREVLSLRQIQARLRWWWRV